MLGLHPDHPRPLADVAVMHVEPGLVADCPGAAVDDFAADPDLHERYVILNTLVVTSGGEDGDR